VCMSSRVLRGDDQARPGWRLSSLSKSSSTTSACEQRPSLALVSSISSVWTVTAAVHPGVVPQHRGPPFLAHSKNELIQWRGVRRLSVSLSVNF